MDIKFKDAFPMLKIDEDGYVRIDNEWFSENKRYHLVMGGGTYNYDWCRLIGVDETYGDYVGLRCDITCTEINITTAEFLFGLVRIFKS